MLITTKPVFIVLAVLIALAAAWSPEDREIFALRDAVQKDLGAEKTFYDWLKVERSASDGEIAKAYRKMSQKLHPDKNPSKAATDRFARLGLVVKVLRSEKRERYDFFLDHGFPMWKGTDYYYSRYRPGLGTVLVFLYLLSATAQYWFKRLTAHQHRKHMSSIIEEAKDHAWSGGMPGSQRKVTLSSGKTFMVHPTGQVNLIDENIEYPLDLDEIQNPTWKDTILYSVPMMLYYKTTGKQPSQDQTPSSESPAENEPKKKLKPKPAQKVGPRRRK